MPIDVSLITESDIPGAITCIQRAFEHDPYHAWAFDDSKFNADRNAISLGLRCRWGMKHALFYVAKDTASSEPDKVLGIACWLPPRKATDTQTWAEWAGDWWLWLQQGFLNMRYGHGGLITERYWIWKAAQAKAQKELWTAPEGYYFMNIVTVLPETQGKGVGKLLVNKVTDIADKEGLKCYLESSRNVPNTAIYNRLGFHLVKEMVLDDNGDKITLFCMMREPKQLQ